MNRTPTTATGLATAASSAALLVVLTACGATGSTVRPPEPAAPVPTGAAGDPTAAPAPQPSATGTAAGVRGRFDGDPAAVALRDYLREQARAVNAGTADPAAVPAFTATLTEQARGWALPLLQENLGDEMPGPYPVGVLGSTRTGADRVRLDLCLQDRGWQVERGTGRTVNAPRFQTGTALVVRVGDRWLVDDVVVDGGACGAADVVQERF